MHMFTNLNQLYTFYRDLAARNCHLSSNLNLKLGDYGLGATLYPEDYYQGSPAVPVRWCAPETVSYTNTTIQAKNVNCKPEYVTPLTYEF